MKCFMNSLGFRRLLAVRRTIHEVFYDQTWTQDIIGGFFGFGSHGLPNSQCNDGARLDLEVG
jgi:hypothetical protein